jgi:hypothetical protein
VLADGIEMEGFFLTHTNEKVDTGLPEIVRMMREQLEPILRGALLKKAVRPTLDEPEP